MTALRRACIAPLRFIALLLALAAIPALARAAEVTTFAGSGQAGFADGTSANASFLMPEGLALAPNGDVYVADAAAQRIRRIDRNGNVTTVAGSGNRDASGLWVPGGFADGPAKSAKFDRPAAIAVSPSGTIVVADSGNHCLRSIAGGTVSTYAGRCGESGAQDGTRESARFAKPLALAYDSHGTLYVADLGNGIRKVGADGTVTSIAPGPPYDQPLAQATGVTVYEGGDLPLLFIATRDGLMAMDLNRSTIVRFYKTGLWDFYDKTASYVAGTRIFGYPYAVAVADDYKIVYTDIATNAVRFLAAAGTNVAAGSPTENASFSAGDFRDGDSAQARVDQPMGVVRLSNGTFLVADTGNRRIRAIAGIDFRYQTSPAELGADTNSYRIVYVGDSAVSNNQAWDESVSGILEKRFRQNWRELGFPKPPRVYPRQVIANLNKTRDFINEYLASGLADMVVLQLNSGQIALPQESNRTTFIVGVKYFEYGWPQSIVPYASQWQPMVTGVLRSISDNLSKNGIPFVVAINPLGFEISPAESGYLNVFQNPYYPATSTPGTYVGLGALLSQAVNDAGVPLIDAFPAFEREELLPDHPALFGARDMHLSVQGVALNAQIILQELLRTKPWKNHRT